MKKYCLVTAKNWHGELFDNLQSRINEDWTLISDKSLFTKDYLKEKDFDKIFIPHWSHIIGSDIYNNFECIVFHMTDLPYGRGGSPLQNLIVNGHKATKISAIKVSKGIDTGDVYLKMPLTLEGTAAEIFLRAIPVIEKMIINIIENDIKPEPQDGDIVHFKRRTPEDGNIEELISTKDVYDYIRMLDCEGYPSAFLESENIKFEFSNAKLNSDGSVNANVRIIQK